MDKNLHIQKVLEEILSTESFDKLEEFSDAERWSDLSYDQRELLAKLFVLRGKQQLKSTREDPEKYQHALISFENASTVVSSSWNIWYSKAAALASEEKESLLEVASYCFEKSAELNETNFDVWYGWANVLVRLGVKKDSLATLEEAQDKFLHASNLLSSPKNKEQVYENARDFFWHWGLLQYMLFTYSGEPLELYQAVEKYKKAATLGLIRKDFYNDFANSLVELAVLIGKQDILLEAVDRYLRSIENTEDDSIPDNKVLSVRYFNLACCYQCLFETTSDKNYFTLADEAFGMATKLNQQFANAWRKWGQLDLFGSKLWNEGELVETACQKFGHSFSLAPESPFICARYAETLVYLGSQEENIGMLAQAETILKNSLEQFQENIDLWVAYAHCLVEKGRYFSEEEYYVRAIEKLDVASTLNQANGRLWHIHACAKFFLGELRDDLALVLESLASFQAASKTIIGRFPFFWNDWGSALLFLAETTKDKVIAEDAQSKFEKAIFLHDPVDSVWVCNYGLTLDLLGDLTEDESFFERSVQAFTHALTLDSGFTQARYYLARAYSQLGELTEEIDFFTKALELYQKVIEEDPEDDTVLLDYGLAHAHMGCFFEEDEKETNHHFGIAERLFLQARALGNSHAYYNLACVLALQGNFPDSISFLQKAKEHDALPTYDELVEDEWLQTMQNTASFTEFLKEILIQEEDIQQE